MPFGFDPEQFHLLRPYWLLALIPLALLILWMARRQIGAGNWQAEVDPRLLPYLITESEGKRSYRGLIGFAIAGLLGILALAGPTWEELPQPVFRHNTALIIALDLSRSMDASDIAPSRLTRARHKLIDILEKRREGQTALLVYAARPFVVTPLTDDTRTIISQVNALTTELMPSQGSRPDRAMEEAAKLLQQAGIASGDLLFISDELDPSLLESAPDNLRLNVLAVGTAAGAPIPGDNGSFVKSPTGEIVIPKLDQAAMRQWASAGGGRFAVLANTDRDIDHLLDGMVRDDLDQAEELSGLHSDRWREAGPWLLLLALPLCALAFRRGILILAAVLILPMPQEAQALDWPQNWRDLFFTPDQQGAALLEQNQPEEAAHHFENPEWQAAARYRAGDYPGALETLKELETPRAHYNRGNALARGGQLKQAIEAYDQALAANPDDADARHNREVVEEALKRQQQQQNSDAQSEPDPQKQQQNPDDSQQEKAGADQGEQEQQQDQQQSQDQPSQDAGQQDGQPQQQPSDQGEQPSADPTQQQQPEDQTGEDQQPQSTQPEPAQHEESEEEQQAAQAQQQAQQEPNQGEAEMPVPAEASEAPSEEQRATEQWLKRIPDDPSGLLRRKFRYQYQRAYGDEGEEQGW